MKALYLIVLTVVLIFSGCATAQPVPEPIVITKKCDTHIPDAPKMSNESGDNPTWLKAVLENSGKKDSFIFDLIAALEKCI